MIRHGGAPLGRNPSSCLLVTTLLVLPIAPSLALAQTALSARVQGAVVDVKGAPVAGAVVVCTRNEATFRAVTDAMGSFDLPLPARGDGTLRVEAAGFLAREMMVKAGPPRVRVVLRARPCWKGRILAAAGHGPVVGASFILADEGGRELGRGRTGTDGRFELRDLDVRPYRLTVEAAGFIRERVGPLVPDEGTTTDVLLSRSVRLAGRVTDEAGRPIPAVPIMVWPMSAAGPDADAKVEGASMADGRFLVEPLPDGKPILVVARTEDHAWAITSAPSPATEPTLTLRAAARLKACGRIADTGAPAKGFRLAARAREGIVRQLQALEVIPSEGQKAEGDACSTLELPGASYRPRGRADGMIPADLAEVDLRPGDEIDLGVVSLDAEAPFSVKVIGPGGEPRDGARVELFGRQGGRTRAGQATTDARGRAMLRGIAAGTYDVEVTADGAIPVWEEKVQVPGRERSIRLQAGGTVRGEVVEAGGGAPVTVYRLSVVPLQVYPDRPDYRFVKILRAAGTQGHDGSGRFTLHGVPEGRYALRVQARGYAASTTPFQIEPGHDSEVRVELKPASCATGLVASRLDGSPVSGAMIRAIQGLYGFPGETGETLAQSDADGRYEVCDLEPGAARAATADHPDFAPASLSLRAGQTGTVLLDPGAGLEGRLAGADGRGVRGWSVRVQGEGWERRGETESDGAFRFERLAPGRARVVLSDPLADEYEDREERDVVLDASKTAELEVLLGGVLSGRVLQGGAALAGVSVRSIRLEEGGDTPTTFSLRRTRTDEDGRYTLPRMTGGTYIVQALLEDQLVNRVTRLGPDGGEYDIRVGPIEASGVTVDGDQGTVLAGVEARTAPLARDEAISEFNYLLRSGGGLVEVHGFTADVTASWSGGDGRVRLSVDTTTPAVILRHEGFLDAEAPITRFLPSQVPTLPLYRGGSLSVRLLAPGGGAPCQGFVTIVGLGDLFLSDSQQTNAVGETRFGAVRQGMYEVWGRCEGTASTRLDALVEIGPGDQKEETLLLGLGGRIDLWIADDGRTPRERLRLRDDQVDHTTALLWPLLETAAKDSADGVFHLILERFPAGSFALEDAGVGVRAFSVREGQQADVRFAGE